MITHNVFFWLKSGLSDQDVKKLETGLHGLGSISEVHSISIATPAATPEREVTDKSFGYALTLKFKSIEDHDTYQEHLDHLKFVETCSQLWKRVVVYDSREI